MRQNLALFTGQHNTSDYGTFTNLCQNQVKVKLSSQYLQLVQKGNQKPFCSIRTAPRLVLAKLAKDAILVTLNKTLKTSRVW